ncbi:MAG: hypothetical protein NZU63_10030 [Gemmataceae bacterium]|nr:hypothetical protein [Gemmataceae bacterium]MDW8242182.1 hypothetical protein [Thermogemmata sp.]
MHIIIESRRKKLDSIQKARPETLIIDMTSKGPEPWVRFSPLYPHGGIPIPNTPDQTAWSVEGLWQGLKVFEREDIDPRKWLITDMSHIKRGGKRRGAILGHRFGVNSSILLDYRQARLLIYLPAYKWVLEHRLQPEVALLRRLATAQPLVLLDYQTNTNVNDTSRPLSHAALIRYYLQDSWPTDDT